MNRDVVTGNDMARVALGERSRPATPDGFPHYTTLESFIEIGAFNHLAFECGGSYFVSRSTVGQLLAAKASENRVSSHRMAALVAWPGW